MSEDQIVAVGLLTQREVELLGHGLSRLWPVDDSPCFTELIKAIDEAERRQKEEARIPTPKQPHPMPGGGGY